MAPTVNDRGTPIPDRVDLRQYLWPVENLGDVFGSAASAATTALEYHCNRMGEEPTDLSTMFVYYNARLLDGDENTHKGTTMQAVMKAISTYGACREATWPFDGAAFSVRPSPEAYAEAKKFAVQGYHPDDACEALAAHYPVPFAARMPQRCLDEAGRTGVFPPLTAEERTQSNAHSGHAMVLVGYDKTARTFTARNCWGEAWGDKGHCAIAFDTLTSLIPRSVGYLWIIIPANTNAGTKDVGQAPPAAAPPASQPDTLAALSESMRQDIRSSLQRDLAESAQRIKDMLKRTP